MTDSIRTLARSLARELDTDEIDLVGGAYGPLPGQGVSPTGAAITRCWTSHVDPGGYVHRVYQDDEFRGNP